MMEIEWGGEAILVSNTIALVGEHNAIKCAHRNIVEWTFNRQRQLPQNAHLLSNSSVLVLINLQLNNIGEYACHGKIFLGLESYKVIDSKVYLKVLGKSFICTLFEV